MDINASPHLTGQRPFVSQVKAFNQLLRQGTSALHDTTGLGIHPKRTGNTG